MFFRFPMRSNAWLYLDRSEYFIWRNCPKLYRMGHQAPDFTQDVGQGPGQGLWLWGL